MCRGENSWRGEDSEAKSLGEGKPGGKPGGIPENPKFGGRESMDAMDTIVREEGGRLGGEVAGEAEEGEEGGEASLNWLRSVGAGGAGMLSILESCTTATRSIH